MYGLSHILPGPLSAFIERFDCISFSDRQSVFAFEFLFFNIFNVRNGPPFGPLIWYSYNAKFYVIAFQIQDPEHMFSFKKDIRSINQITI